MVALIAALLFNVVKAKPSVQPYQVTDDHAIEFGGSEFRPLGLHLPGTPSIINAALQAGVRDFIIDLPSNGQGWNAAISALEGANARYLIAISDSIPNVPSWTVEPELYRSNHLNGTTTFDAVWNGTDKALATWSTTNVGAPAERQLIPTPAGHMNVTVPSPSDNSIYSFVAFPHTTAGSLTDFWEGLDERRDQLIRTLREFPPQPGLRGIMNPLGPNVTWPDDTTVAIPDSNAFRREFASWITQAYEQPLMAERSWTMGANDLRTTEELSQLIPLWSHGHGLSQFWIPGRDVSISADSGESRYWLDVRAVMRGSALRRFSRLTAYLRHATGAPVLQTWTGFGGPYEGDVELDGIVAKVGADINVDSSGPASSLDRRSFSTWGIADLADISLSDSFDQKLANLSRIGFQAVYIRPNGGDLDSLVNLIRGKTAGKEPAVQKLYYPLWSDVTIEPGPVGHWWAIPRPEFGERIISLGGVQGFTSLHDGIRNTALWTLTPHGSATIKTEEGDYIVARDSTGRTIAQRQGGSLKVNLTPDPIMLEHKGSPPVDDLGFQTYSDLMRSIYGVFGPAADADGGMLAAVNEAQQQVNRSPVSAMKRMRDEAEAMCIRVARFAWLKGYQGVGNTGVAVPTPGSRYGKAWLLDSAVEPRSAVSWTFDQSSVLAFDIWVAAKMSPGSLVPLSGVIDGQPFKGTGQSESRYGAGFAWYRLGHVQLGKGTHTISLQMPSGTHTLIDTVMVTPYAFKPDGPNFPIPMIADQLKLGPKQK